jgi:hypothetical protein
MNKLERELFPTMFDDTFSGPKPVRYVKQISGQLESIARLRSSSSNVRIHSSRKTPTHKSIRSARVHKDPNEPLFFTEASSNLAKSVSTAFKKKKQSSSILSLAKSIIMKKRLDPNAPEKDVYIAMKNNINKGRGGGE